MINKKNNLKSKSANHFQKKIRKTLHQRLKQMKMISALIKKHLWEKNDKCFNKKAPIIMGEK